ncbi:MAG: HAD family acid phosphatase [Rudaea sp.]
MHRFLAFFLPLALLAGCAATTPKPSAPNATTVAPNSTGAIDNIPADDSLNATAWVQTAVEHDLIYLEIYRIAQEKLPAALADKTWDALPFNERNKAATSLPPAVVLDIDETVLDNSPNQARLIRDGKQFNEAGWAQWCKEGIAKPMAGALQFTRYAASHGVAVFYLSNRKQELDAVTLKNLRDDGFPVANADSFLGLGLHVDGCEAQGSNKGCRRELIARKYRVLMQFGDQLGDFLDVPANTLAERRAVVEPYLDWLGDRWFVLPNPVYGHWEPALFNNDWKLSPSQRRAEKRAALHTD